MRIRTITTSLLLLSSIALSQSIGVGAEFNNNSIELTYHQRIANAGGFLSICFSSGNAHNNPDLSTVNFFHRRAAKLGISLPPYNVFQFIFGLQYNETTKFLGNSGQACSGGIAPGPLPLCRVDVVTNYTTSLFFGTIIDINDPILRSDNLYFTYDLSTGSSTVGLSWDIH